MIFSVGTKGVHTPAELQADVTITAADPPITISPAQPIGFPLDTMPARGARVMLRFPSAGPAVVGGFLVGGPDLHSGESYQSRTVIVLGELAAEIAHRGADFELYYEDAEIGAGRLLE